MIADKNCSMEAVTLAYDLFEQNDVRQDANPIILIHGIFWNKFMMKELGRALSKETKRKVYTLDLRNHNESPSCKKCDMVLMTEDIKKFFRDHNIKTATFICHSFSSPIAYLIALEQPQLVEKMVMIDHGPYVELSEKNRLENVLSQYNAQNRFLRSLDPKLTLADAKKKILSIAAMPSATKAQELFLKKVAYDLLKEGQKFKWKTDIDFVMEKYTDMAFVVKAKGRCEHEILIVRCSNSVRVSDEKFVGILKQNPNAKLETIDDTTHLLMLEKMDIFVEIVKKFLDS
ncbi:sn-1-specific diacylglycerol lipase ABHD11-like isoform X2 [Parasteatoda tepidariorum]|uniref:sn-1-specific diacylglycerol lipase ABHD11-like isoform X2 n=1 Tax=Parasteatoda tepidariorum TaxID=114398 RepID=UPI001C722F4B|nr:protein ABHD11-like [Parasteatoda tepidariorum]